MVTQRSGDFNACYRLCREVTLSSTCGCETRCQRPCETIAAMVDHYADPVAAELTRIAENIRWSEDNEW